MERGVRRTTRTDGDLAFPEHGLPHGGLRAREASDLRRRSRQQRTALTREQQRVPVDLSLHCAAHSTHKYTENAERCESITTTDT